MANRPHHRVHRSGLPVRVVGGAVPPPAAVALRRRDRVAAADGRPRRQRATSTRTRASRRRSSRRALRRPLARARHADGHVACATGMSATAPACRAVVAARLHAPEAEAALLRALRVRNFAGEALEDESTRAGAARDAGLDPAALEAWMARRRDRAAARRGSRRGTQPDAPPPSRRTTSSRPPATAAATPARPTRSSASKTGRRSTCPAFSRTPPTRSRSPTSRPDAQLREPPESVLELLEWAGEPLATREVAVVCDIAHDEARQRLGRVARSVTSASTGSGRRPERARTRDPQPSRVASLPRTPRTPAGRVLATASRSRALLRQLGLHSLQF